MNSSRLHTWLGILRVFEGSKIIFSLFILKQTNSNASAISFTQCVKGDLNKNLGSRQKTTITR